MSNHIAHFAVHADDVERARRFYGGVFGWKFEAWGPPGFFLIETGPVGKDALRGALQNRMEVVPGKGMYGYECSISVTSVDETAQRIENHDGKVLAPKVLIPGVGWILKFQDTEGNIADIVHYDREGHDRGQGGGR